MDQIQLQWLGFCKCLGAIGFFFFFWYSGIIPFFLSRDPISNQDKPDDSIINKIRNYLISKWAKNKTAPSRIWFTLCGFVFIIIFAIKVEAFWPILTLLLLTYFGKKILEKKL